MTEEADRFTLTTGPDGRALLSLALRRHPRVSADNFARAQRYWACVPGGGQPRWLSLRGDPGSVLHAEDPREAADAHAAAAAYLPGVPCSDCRDRTWKPVNRRAVTRYVLTGITAGCLACHRPEPEPARAPVDVTPVRVAEARSLPAVTVRIEGAAAALLWSAAGGDGPAMSSLVNDLVARNFGVWRAGA